MKKTKEFLKAKALRDNKNNKNNKNNNMEFKVKKGKWRLVTNDENDLFGGLDNYNKIVSGCEFYDKDNPNLGFSISAYISKENALLISKAPEMLEMLEKLRGYGAEYGMPNKLYIELEQLIKEATEL